MTTGVWLSTPTAHALGRALMHFVWEGALAAGALWAVLFWSASRTARFRHRAAVACLLGLPLIFSLTVALSLPAGSAAPVTMPAATLRTAPNLVPTTGAPAEQVDRVAWLAPLWMGGVMLFYVFRVGGWLRVDWMRRRGVCAAPAEWQQRLRTLGAELRVARPIMLLESCLAGVPLVIGYWRPVILMPLGALAGLSAEQVEAILIHELAHIRRADYLVSLAQSLIEGLFFFHPAVWWISGVVRTEREYACDDAVMALRPDARAYAAALTILEQSRWSAFEAAPAATGGNLVKRVRRLLDDPAPAGRTGMRTPAVAGVLLAVGAMAAALAIWPPARGFAQQGGASAPTAGQKEAADAKDDLRARIAELEELLAIKEKEMREMGTAAGEVQENLERNAAELARELTEETGSRFGEQEKALRDALQQLESSRTGIAGKELEEQQRALREASRQLEAAQEEAAKAQGDQSGERLQRQLAMEQARQQLANAENASHLTETLREEERRLEQASEALRDLQGKEGAKEAIERQLTLERRLIEAQREIERAAGAWEQGRSGQAAAGRAETAEPQAGTVMVPPYQKWLNEDVAYLITAKERRAFQALGTDAERSRFIEQFWLRRDPTPGTARNEFQEEHYRRIAYANEHFAAGVPGWKTDRGRIYIMYGPPDQIENHSADATPRQAWLYTHIAGLGYRIEVEFTDPGKTGDFRMAAEPASRGSYWQLMVSASDAAGAVKQTLRTGGFPTLTYPVEGQPGQVRVMVGPYTDEASFARAKAALEAAGYHPTKAQ